MGQHDLTEQAQDLFTRFLRRNKLKMTRERRLILEELFKDDDHLEAEDLLVRFRRRGDKVSRATIYRTFDLLIKAGLIKKSDFGESHYHYEKIFGIDHHDHLVCERCGVVIEFSNPELEELQKKICEEEDFSPTSHSLQIFGCCSKCKS